MENIQVATVATGKTVAQGIIEHFNSEAERWQDPANHYVVQVLISAERDGTGYYVKVDTATDPDGDFGYTDSTVIGRHVPGMLLKDVILCMGYILTECAEMNIHRCNPGMFKINPEYSGFEKEA